MAFSYNLKGIMMHIDSQTLKELGRQKVVDEKERSKRLSELWKNKRVVLVFIRHFG
jgi:hypothetical protein